MATKKAPRPTSTTYAPDPGSDSEFDEIWEKVNSTIDSASGWDAETMASVDEYAEKHGVSKGDAARMILAEKMVKHGNKQYTERPVYGDNVPEEEPEPEKERTLRIPPRPTDPYWYDDPADAELVEHYILSRRALGNVMHGALLISGPAGSGKTMGVPHAIKRINAKHKLNLTLTKMDCVTVTDPQKWFGRREVDKDGTRYVPSNFVLAVERGDVVLLDDLSRLHPHLHNSIFGLLDGSEAVHISDLNLTVNRHPETVFIATTNVGVQYGGTHRMDWAFRERFAFNIERDFPPHDDEVRILTSYTGCDEDGAEAMVDIARKTRDMYARGELRNVISTRTLVAAAWLVSSGFREHDALERTALPLFDGDANGLVGQESDRQKVASTIDLRFGKRGQRGARS